MKVSSRWMVSALAAAALAGCGAEDPARFGRPPVVSSFDPASQHLTAFVGDTLQFSLLVTDPDGDRVRTSFAIDGKARGVGSPWTYVVSDTGSVTVRGSVTDGEFVSYIDWLVEGLEPIDLPPVIENYQPVERNPTLIVGKRMTFAVVARDPEAMPLTYSFTVNDSLVAQSRQFEYLARSVGAKLVRATVSDGEYTVAHAWNLRVTAVPDTIPPAVVVITAAGTGAEPGEIYLEWIAVGKDGMVGMPSQYQVRTAPDPFSSEEEWERGSQRQGVPAPAAPGETMSMTIGGLLPARTTHVTVRAVDDFGNISPLGQSPSAVTRGMRISGTVVDAISGQPVPNALVRLGTFTAVTGADGSWRLEELPPIDDFIKAGDPPTTGVGSHYDVSIPYVVVHQAVTTIPLIPNLQLQTTYYNDFLQFFREMTDIPGNPFGTQQRRWKLPINLYVRPYEKDGLDYKAAIERVAGDFDAILGTQVFKIVPNRTSPGVETVYRDGVPQDNYFVTEWTSDWYPNIGLIEFRNVYTPATQIVLERTARHELGHALGLHHSFDPTHLMVGGVAPYANAFTPDEIAVIRCLYGLPRGFDTRRFLRQ